MADGRGYIDPCELDYDDHFQISTDFRLEGRSQPAIYMIERLHLNRTQLQKLRRQRNEAQENFSLGLSLFEFKMKALEEQVEKMLQSEARIILAEALATLRSQYETYKARWEKRFEPLINSEDY